MNSKKILNTVNKPSEYMIQVWKIILCGLSFTTREVHNTLIKKMNGKHPSRASVINYLDSMVATGLVTYEEDTGKGGVHRVYTLKGTQKDFSDTLSMLNNEQFLEAYMIPLGAQQWG